MTIDDALALLVPRVQPGDHLIFGGDGQGREYIGLRHADGTDEFATDDGIRRVCQLEK